MTGSRTPSEAIQVGETGPCGPDQYTENEIADYTPTKFFKYQILKLDQERRSDKDLIQRLQEDSANLAAQCKQLEVKYSRSNAVKASLIVEYSILQGMSAFAAAILGFVPQDKWFRMLGWLLLTLGVVLSVFKGVLTPIIIRCMPDWMYDDSPRDIC